MAVYRHAILCAVGRKLFATLLDLQLKTGLVGALHFKRQLAKCLCEGIAKMAFGQKGGCAIAVTIATRVAACEGKEKTKNRVSKEVRIKS